MDGWIATMSTGLAVAADDTACDAASCVPQVDARLHGLARPPRGSAPAVASTRSPGPSIRMVSDGRPASCRLVGLLDPALADQVAGLVRGAERLGLGGGGRDHVAGQQREGAGLGDRRRAS